MNSQLATQSLSSSIKSDVIHIFRFFVLFYCEPAQLHLLVIYCNTTCFEWRQHTELHFLKQYSCFSVSHCIPCVFNGYGKRQVFFQWFPLSLVKTLANSALIWAVALLILHMRITYPRNPHTNVPQLAKGNSGQLIFSSCWVAEHGMLMKLIRAVKWPDCLLALWTTLLHYGQLWHNQMEYM